MYRRRPDLIGNTHWRDRHGRRFTDKQVQHAVRNRGLARLGFTSYDEYLSSSRWLRTRARYLASELSQRCIVCKCTTFDLHHLTYRRLGREHLEDLVPLCRRHHDEVHAYVFLGYPLATAHLSVAAKHERVRKRAEGRQGPPSAASDTHGQSRDPTST